MILLPLIWPLRGAAQYGASPCDCGSFTVIGEFSPVTAMSNISNFSGQCVLIYGTLVIDELTILTNVRAKMAEGSRILVGAYGLDISDSYFSGCGDMWHGIQVSGGGNIVAELNRIQDALYGIYLEPDAAIYCSYNDFVNDFIGIAAGNPFDADQFGVMISQKGNILGNRFFTETTLPDPMHGIPYYPSWPTSPPGIPYDKGFAAIYLSGVTMLNIGVIGAKEGDRNAIFNMRNGIISRYSACNISGTDFYDFEGQVPGSTPDPVLDLNQVGISSYVGTETVTDNTFGNLMIGYQGDWSVATITNNTFDIFSGPSSLRATRGITVQGPQHFHVTGNVITNGYIGISVERSINPIRINGNTLGRSLSTIGHTGISVSSLGDESSLVSEIKENLVIIIDGYGATGLSLLHIASPLHVTANKISYAATTAVSPYNTGIRGHMVSKTLFAYDSIVAAAGYVSSNLSSGISLSNSGYNTLFCNFVNNFSRNILITGPNEQTKLLTNGIGNAEVGLELHGPAMIGQQYHHENRWVGDYDYAGAFVSGTGLNQTIVLSHFIVNPATTFNRPNPIRPEEIEDDGFWFTNDSGNGLSCHHDPIDLIPVEDSLEVMIRRTLDFSDYNDETTWMMKAGLFDLLLWYPDLTVSSAVLDSFFEAEYSTPLGVLAHARYLLGTRHGVQKIDKAAALDDMLRLSSELVSIDSVIALHPVDSLDWMALRVLKVDTLTGTLAGWHDLLEDEAGESEDVYLGVYDDLDNLATTSDIEEYLREALMLKAAYLTGTALTGGDSTALVAIAALCPWEGGPAIALAGELLLTLTDSSAMIPLEVSCTPPAPFLAPGMPGYLPAAIHEALTMYPNPVHDRLTVRTSAPAREVTVTGITGQALRSYRPAGYRFDLDLGDLPAGLYIITAYVEQGVITQKISIQR